MTLLLFKPSGFENRGRKEFGTIFMTDDFIS